MGTDKHNNASFCQELSADDKVLGQKLFSDEDGQGSLWSVDEC